MGEWWENAILAQSFPIGGSCPARGTHLLKRETPNDSQTPLQHTLKYILLLRLQYITSEALKPLKMNYSAKNKLQMEKMGIVGVTC